VSSEFAGLMLLLGQSRPVLELHDVLWPHVLGFLIALWVTTAFTPIARKIAAAGHVYDLPDGGLKPHEQPVPYLGGLAMFLGWAGAMVYGIAAYPGGRGWFVGLLIAGAIMTALGLVDDVWSIRPRVKLLGQVVAAGVLLAFGMGTRLIMVFVDGGNWLLGTSIVLPEWLVLGLSGVAVVALVIAFSNAMNLIDGLDGLCSGVSAIISLGLAGIALHWALYSVSVTGDPVRIVLALAILGASLGFLPYNFNPAKIFMGDAGSMLLGFSAAAMVILFGTEEGSILRWILGALMVCALPLFDTTLAVVRRLRNRRPIMAGDRSHFYDQLVDRGLSVRQTVLVCYALAVLFAALGCLAIYIRTRYAAIVYVGVVIAIAVAVVAAGMVRKLPPGADTGVDSSKRRGRGGRQIHDR